MLNFPACSWTLSFVPPVPPERQSTVCQLTLVLPSAQRANAVALGNRLMKRGYKLATDGTDNHLVLWDLRKEVCCFQKGKEAVTKLQLTRSNQV